jgi:hypothetical protein
MVPNSLQPSPSSVGFARWVFLLAGIVGVLEVAPMYFYEATLNRTQPPPITHPDFYYGFVGLAGMAGGLSHHLA